MSLKTRSVVVSTIAAVACLFAVASASALTVSPTGVYSADSTNTRLALSSNGQALTCSDSLISTTIAANGTGTVASGNARYTGCNNAILGAFTVTQTSAWSLTTTLLGTTSSPRGVALNVTVPTSGVSVAGAGCTFYLSGTVVLLKAITALPATITGASVISSSLRIDRNSGGFNCLFFPVGLASVYSGDYTLSRGATVSG